jgi:DNA-binding transcriptional LysR family regulator
MLDGVSLDQLRTFIAVADEKSFSAAGRRLRRAQSVVSQTMANLEGQLGVKLFDRTARFPVLTDQGRALLSDARAVAGDVDVLKARAKNLAGGLEPELSVAVDVMFPPAPLTAAVAAFQQEFPSTLLNFEVESSAVVEPVGCEFTKCSSSAHRCTIPHVEFQVWYGLRHARSYGSGYPFARHLGEASASGRRARCGRRIFDPQASTGHRRSFTQTCSELDIL